MLTVGRWRYQKKGFRAKLSNGLFVFDDGRPVAGPFENRRLANHERERIKGERMKEQQTKEVKETKTQESTDPSDTHSAKNTNDGTSPDDGREEESESVRRHDAEQKK